MGARTSEAFESHGPAAALRLLVAAGGTGGHIFPALAVAEELRARALERGAAGPGCEIEFMGAGRELESRLIPAAGFPLHTIEAAGLKGIGGFRRLRNLLVLPRSAWQSQCRVSSFRPNVVFGTGAYLAGPVMLEAALQDIATLLFEPNFTPGCTNRLLAPVVRRVAVGFEETSRYFGAKACPTGHPVREGFFRVRPRPRVPPWTVLILGGSQGAKAINDCVVGALPLLAAAASRLSFIHQTGVRDYNAVVAARDGGSPGEVCAFIDDMPTALARADVVVSRSGAMTVAELAAAGKASVLIPFPGAADRHQLENARAMERAGAARVIEDRDLTSERLVREIEGLLAQPERLAEMETKARALGRPDAAERIADLIEGLARQGLPG